MYENYREHVNKKQSKTPNILDNSEQDISGKSHGS